MALLTPACAAGIGATAELPLEDCLALRVEAWAERAGVPAVVAVVAREGTAPITVGSGSAGESQPVTARTQFRIASITKLFVAALVMDLVEEGVLELDMTVDEHLDLPPPLSGVSVRHLLSHTSGIPDYGAETFFQGLVDHPDRRWDPAEILDTITDVRPAFAPGTDYEYSNTNFVVLGELVEAVTGRSWHRELRRRILDPLGLGDTYVASLEATRGLGLVDDALFDLDGDGDLEDVEEGPWPALETSEGAAGAIISTAQDVTKFTTALFTGHLLSPDSVDQMVVPSPFAARSDDYGLGVELRHPDLRTLAMGHGGFLPGYRSVSWYVPAARVAITVLVNNSDGDRADLATLLLAELAP